MPKRILDGDGLWRSDKIATIQAAWIKAEYANLLPLALANGSFEASARRIWSTVYSYNRPEITLEQVEAILAELERVKLLFRWTDPPTGKDWGFWVGIDRAGRLPTPSRLKDRHEKTGLIPPVDKLAEFLGKPAGTHPATVGEPIGSLGFGFGSGFGTGPGAPMGTQENGATTFPQRKKNPFNATEIAQMLCQQNGWSGHEIIWALEVAIEHRSKQMPEASLEQSGEWLVNAYLDHQANKGQYAVGIRKFLSEARYPSSESAAKRNNILVDNPATRALAQMEGD
jgi:hypothetical protein